MTPPWDRITLTICFILLHEFVTALCFGGYTFGKLLLGLAATAKGNTPPALAVRLQRVGLKLLGVGIWRSSLDGLPAHDHLLGINYSSPILSGTEGPATDHDWKIRILTGRRKGEAYWAHIHRRFRKQGRIRIGRHPRWADLVLPDRMVSRSHAELLFIGSRLEIVDLASRNGTIVNGRRLPPEVRADGGGICRVVFGGAKHGVEVEIIRRQIN